ncbi:hypothetical protein FRX31_020684 [Thalictrum thalictroides]|uniref:Uncharacterized protein n=1 Tax=Thalictrum thalictroides TaxID=46969 RepID=A0A7J6VYR7_THATH|nr:hypothetical protein FRX31_020684 [Thalictrum thalictroides]
MMTTRVARIEDTLTEMMEMMSRLAVALQQPIQTVVDNSSVDGSKGVDDPIPTHRSEKNSDYNQHSLHPRSLPIVLEDDSEVRQNRIHAWLHERDDELEEKFDIQGARDQQVRADLRRPAQVANSGYLRGQRIDPGRVLPLIVGRQQQQPQDRVLRGPRQDFRRRNQQQQRHRGADFSPIRRRGRNNWQNQQQQRHGRIPRTDSRSPTPPRRFRQAHRQAAPDFYPPDPSESNSSTSPPRRNHHNHHAPRNQRCRNHGNNKDLAFKDIYDLSNAIKYALKAEDLHKTITPATSTPGDSSSKPIATSSSMTCYHCKEVGHRAS